MNYKSYTVLIVDDEQGILDELSDFLSLEFNVIAEIDSMKVMEILQSESIDLILLDIKMPKLSGIELCKLIKQDERCLNIPIMFLTSFSDIENTRECFECGAVDYLTKPFNLEELMIRIDVRLDFSKKINQLLDAQISLNETIYKLSSELKEISTSSILNEESFLDQESKFSRMNRVLEKNKKRTDNFNIAITNMEKRILKQKEMILRSKELLHGLDKL